MATEVGMLYPLQMAAPQVRFIPANAEASCRYMKMITLPKLRDSLAQMRYEVRVPRGRRRARPRPDRPHGGDRLAAPRRPALNDSVRAAPGGAPPASEFVDGVGADAGHGELLADAAGRFPRLRRR